jgi:hypothetical protein
MNKEIGNRVDKYRPIAFLDSDNADFSFLTITEGGEDRFSLLNNNISENIRPYYIAYFPQLVDVYCKREFFLKPELEDIFAFKIANKQVSVETEKIRKELSSCPTVKATSKWVITILAI